ncbi:MAG: RNA polymerase sigma factor [Capsulimonadales bacterium]|nr:RNA polymerase sigma factor [Capsulimonadales bacterium]
MVPTKTMVLPFLARPDMTFERIWAQERPRIRRLTARLSGNLDLADDLTQEVGIRALAAYPNFRRQSSESTWLYRIAVNVVLRWREQQGADNIHGVSGEKTLAVLPSALPTPEHATMRSEQMQAMYRALDELPEDLRTPLLLHVWEGMKYREIAVILGIPSGTVMSRLHSARQRLRLALKDWEDESI